MSYQGIRWTEGYDEGLRIWPTWFLTFLFGKWGKVENKVALGKNSKAEGIDI
jgi:hypothetical protein